VRGMFNCVDVQSLELGDAKLLRWGSALMAKKGIAQSSATKHQHVANAKVSFTPVNWATCGLQNLSCP
jgi:hypothetical protein